MLSSANCRVREAALIAIVTALSGAGAGCACAKLDKLSFPNPSPVPYLAGSWQPNAIFPKKLLVYAAQTSSARSERLRLVLSAFPSSVSDPAQLWIYETSDSGQSWRRTLFPCAVFSFLSTSTRDFAYCSSAGVILSTRNSDVGWLPISPQVPRMARAFNAPTMAAAASPAIAFAVSVPDSNRSGAFSTSMHVSPDGEGHWSLYSDVLPAPVFRGLGTPSVGFAFLGSRSIVTSRDGVAWRSSTPFSTDHYYAGGSISQTGMIQLAGTGRNGRSFYSELDMAGHILAETEIAGCQPVSAVFLPDTTSIVGCSTATGWSIVTSTDRGATWLPLLNRPGERPYTVSPQLVFATKQIGWAFVTLNSQEFKVWKTLDGKNWAPFSLPQE